ncbi:uncharacterized protein LOC135130109 isoform X2 [Zophobas morio]|uniref:uncharacterized protein LOC135130109 isoform X2 n=2 Tax=Zophobas morio TaxID=2755281 RepID=UPI0030833C35
MDSSSKLSQLKQLHKVASWTHKVGVNVGSGEFLANIAVEDKHMYIYPEEPNRSEIFIEISSIEGGHEEQEADILVLQLDRRWQFRFAEPGSRAVFLRILGLRNSYKPSDDECYKPSQGKWKKWKKRTRVPSLPTPTVEVEDTNSKVSVYQVIHPEAHVMHKVGVTLDDIIGGNEYDAEIAIDIEINKIFIYSILGDRMQTYIETSEMEGYEEQQIGSIMLKVSRPCQFRFTEPLHRSTFLSILGFVKDNSGPSSHLPSPSSLEK